MHAAAEIQELSKELENKLKGYLTDTEERPEISYELLKILMIADDLVQLANPEKTSGEFFGLPKEVLAGSEEYAMFTNHHGWDFGPWFDEKNVKDGVKKIIKNWELDPHTVELREDAPVSANEFVRYGIDRGLSEVKTYAKLIFDQFFTNQVKAEKE